MTTFATVAPTLSKSFGDVSILLERSNPYELDERSISISVQRHAM